MLRSAERRARITCAAPKRKQPLRMESYAGGFVFRRVYYYTGRIVIGHSGALSGARLTGTSYGAELMQIVESGQVEVSSIPCWLPLH